MFQTFVNAWKIADLRKKILYTCLIVLIFRIGSAIPVPFTNIGEFGIIADPNAGTLKSTFRSFSERTVIRVIAYRNRKIIDIPMTANPPIAA